MACQTFPSQVLCLFRYPARKGLCRPALFPEEVRDFRPSWGYDLPLDLHVIRGPMESRELIARPGISRFPEATMFRPEALYDSRKH